MYIELEYEIDKLNKNLYRFWFQDAASTLWLDEFSIMVRESTRHKFKVIKQYKRISTRTDLNNIRQEDIVLDEKIKQDVIDKLVSQISIDFWKNKFR